MKIPNRKRNIHQRMQQDQGAPKNLN